MRTRKAIVLFLMQGFVLFVHGYNLHRLLKEKREKKTPDGEQQEKGRAVTP